MQHFQPILIAIGILAIVGVLIHGFLLNRKSKLAEQATQQENETEALESAQEQDEKETDLSNLAFKRDIEVQKQSKVEPTLDLNTLETDFESTGDSASLSAVTEQDNADEIIDTDTGEVNQHSAEQDEVVIVEEKPTVSQPQDLFIFNVVAREESMLGGHKLLQFFLTSGFRFGEMNIFHRHENSDGTGEIQFSIANMMAPGTFDLDEMEQFTTKGISFFLTAPNPKISVKQSFDLMLRAVVQMADEFDCDVLNEQREVLTESQFIEYRNRLQQYP